jgi:hypothetical protein
MASLAAPRTGGDERFFMKAALAMALIVIAGFSTQLAMGRSSFASPIRVHIHALLFMGWVAIFVTQNALIATGSLARHRQLGWIAVGWMMAMVVSGFVVTLSIVRRGVAPFFFQPLQFLVFDPLTVLTFAAVTIAAVMMRRQTDWHRRLHYCGMALLLGPAFGRLLPMPLLIPYAFEATAVPILIIVAIGMLRDRRQSGHIHRAWLWGVGAIVGMVIMTNIITYSPLGPSLYRAVTAGSPGAAVPPLAFPPPPSTPLITGRGTSI